jgi:selenide,water dikinase
LQLNSGASVQALSALAPHCAGASTKVDANILSRVLGSLQTLEHEEVLIGRHEVNNTAMLKVPSGKAVVQTVDFCRSFIDDPYLFGQITANHTLGHIDAMGAKPQAATAICTVPPGLDVKIEDLLLQMMSGAVQVLNAAGCPLVGGHTGEGRELALGFAINGLIDDQPDRVMRKSGMQPGDILVLTKPIGTGTLLAANARGAARGRWIDEAVRSMLVPHQIAAQILSTHGTTACTDVSGFGLLGHLVEMTRSSGVHAELHLSALPLLDGALDCAQAGILSALQASNMQLRNAVRHPKDFVQDPRYRLLFDPQTAGGLLASVPAAQVAACMASLRAAGYAQAAIIGQVNAQSAAIEPVILKL